MPLPPPSYYGEWRKDLQQKMLAKRTVANYNKSIEAFGDLSFNEKGDWNDSLFNICFNIVEKTALYVTIAEVMFFATGFPAIFVFGGYDVIYDRFAVSN